MFSKRSLLICFLALSSFSSLKAQDSSKLAWYQAVTLKGLVMGSTVYNFNHPQDNTNQLRVYDIDAGSLELDLVSLSLRHDAQRGEAGFRFDADLGPHIPMIDRSLGLEMGRIDVRQAFLTYLAPIGSGLKIDVGKFTTPCGYELIEGPDGVSDNASHSFLFGYALPYTHTGIRLGYSIVDQLAISAMLVNGWDNSIDNNTAKTVCAQVTWTPNANANIALAGIIGPEKNANTTDERMVADLAASYKITEYLLIGVSADYGKEQNDVFPGPTADSGRQNISPSDAIWKGVAGYAKAIFTDKFSVALRAEVFDDPNAVRTGTAQSLHEYTLTPIWQITPTLTLKSDLRYDLSSQPVFEHDGGFVTDQSTVSLNVLYSF